MLQGIIDKLAAVKFRVLLVSVLLLAGPLCRAQFTDSASGLLQMPTAEMQESGTFMITNNYLNKHSLSPHGWGYDTFAYGFSITFWSRLELGYVCTIFDGKRKPNPTDRDLIMFNQDRHFYGRVQVLKEGEFGLEWMPAMVVGLSDPTTGSSSEGYVDMNVEGTGNGYFNRLYIALSRHLDTPWGEVGAHLEIGRHTRAAQVEVAVAQADVLGGVHVVLDLEGRRLGGVEDHDLVDEDLDLAGRELGVVHALGALTHDARDLDRPLGADGLGRVERVAAGVLRVKGDLRHAVAVAQVNEDEAAVVAAVPDPAGQRDRLADVLAAQLAAGVGVHGVGVHVLPFSSCRPVPYGRRLPDDRGARRRRTPQRG